MRLLPVYFSSDATPVLRGASGEGEKFGKLDKFTVPGYTVPYGRTVPYIPVRAASLFLYEGRKSKMENLGRCPDMGKLSGKLI